MTATAAAYGDERCPMCNAPLPARSPNSPPPGERYCEQDWWYRQWTLFLAGQPCSPLALTVFMRRAA